MPSLKKLIEACEFRSATNETRYATSKVCGRRGVKIYLSHCSHYGATVTKSKYSIGQREFCCERCELIHAKLGAAP